MHTTVSLRVCSASLSMVGIVMVAGALLCADPAAAHTPIVACFDNGDDTVTCEAGYSDGAPSVGQTVRVLTSNRRLLEQSVFDKTNSYSFKKPAEPFIVEFEGDPSHVAIFDGDDLGK